MSQPRKPKVANKGSLLLHANENKHLFSLLGSGCMTMASAVVQLFVSDADNKTQWNRKGSGVATFIRDQNKQSYYIRIYDLMSEQMVWQQEIYSRFRYIAGKDFFHTFECDECEAGLNFASEDEANDFKSAIDRKLRERKKRKVKQNVKGSAQPQITKKTVNTKNMKTPVLNPGQRKKSISIADIESPQNFKRIGGVGFTDKDMMKLFQEVGIEADGNVDEETVDFIYDFVEQHGGMNEIQREISRRPVPAIPSSIPSPVPSPTPTKKRPVPAIPVVQITKPQSPGRRVRPPPTPCEERSPAPANTRHLPSAPCPPAPPPGGGPPPPPPPPPPPIGGAPKTLKSSVPQPPPLSTTTSASKKSVVPKVNDARNNLLDDIMRKPNLKKVDTNTASRTPSVEDNGGIVGALAKALASRQKAMTGGSDEDSDDSEDGDNDSEWDD